MKGNAVDAVDESVLIVGFGDIGERVARLLSPTCRVSAMVRSPDRFASAQAIGAMPIVGDLDDPSSLAPLGGIAACVFHFAPPPNVGADDARTRNLLEALSVGAAPRELIYISTTGVYGDCAGGWVDESTPLNPETDRAKRRVAAETRLTRWAAEYGVALTILRAPGIYALNRLPLERIRSATPAITAEEDSWSNHIHADDLAAAAIHAMRRHRLPPHGAPLVVNVVDDSQLKMGDYFDLVADHFGLVRSPRVARHEAESLVSPAMLSFMRESRRIGNAKLKTAFGFALRYPTVADFLATVDKASSASVAAG
jgi:nucleoside-diphosphate-sugar epimerase